MTKSEMVDALIAASDGVREDGLTMRDGVLREDGFALRDDGTVSTGIIAVGDCLYSVTLEVWYGGGTLATVRRHPDKCCSFSLFSVRRDDLSDRLNKVQMGALLSWDGSDTGVDK